VAEVKRILIVDDEPKIVEVLERYLTDEGFVVDKAHDGISAVESFRAGRPDLVILDLKLPGISGLDAFHEMRAHADTPIIMLTSRSDEVDRVIGLELGADDYITKPFSPREVVARVKTVLRRLAHANAQSGNGPVASSARPADAARSTGRIVVGALEIDLDGHAVSLEGLPVDLRRLEFELLVHLAGDPERVFGKQELLRAVWRYRSSGSTRTVDSHASRLRRKLEERGGRWVINVWGVGYRLR